MLHSLDHDLVHVVGHVVQQDGEFIKSYHYQENGYLLCDHVKQFLVYYTVAILLQWF